MAQLIFSAQLTVRASSHCPELSIHTCNHSEEPHQIHVLTGLPTCGHKPGEGKTIRSKHITHTSGGEWVRDRERNRREGDAVHVFNTDLKHGLVPGSVEVVGACNVSKLYLICGLMWSHIQWKLDLQKLVRLVPANLHKTIIKGTAAWMSIQLSQPSWTSLCNSLWSQTAGRDSLHPGW